jgi:L-2,4-diaminobutyrate decarboxylase
MQRGSKVAEDVRDSLPSNSLRAAGGTPGAGRPFDRGYDPAIFQQSVETTCGLLARHLGDSLQGRGKVLVQEGIDEIARQLDFDRVIARGGADLGALVEVLLRNSNRLHHPAYVGHQVAVPMAGAAVADLINGATNNSMPVYEMGPAATAVEHKLIDWALSKVGWQAEGSGVMTHGGSMSNLTCLLAARANALPEAWEKGVPPGCAILVPESSHYSNARAAAIMGLGTSGAIPIPVDAEYRVQPQTLARVYEDAVRSGKKVLAVVANACATATGSYDDLVAIGRFCREKGVWLHVDGAHGASALVTGRYRRFFEGIEYADSLTWDTHKMLATSALCGMALFRRRSAMLKTFSQEATYIFNSFEKPGEDISVNTLECTKSMLALKLFFNLALVGEPGLAALVETLYDRTRDFHRLISARPGFSCLCAPDANILCFRYGEDSALQDRIRQRLVLEGDSYITRATIHGKSYLRFSVMNPYTEERHVVAILERIEQLAREL